MYRPPSFQLSHLPCLPTTHSITLPKIATCCRTNGRLYVKFGLSIVSLAAIVPAQYNEELKYLQVDAERMTNKQAEEAMRKGLGEEWEERFS